MTDETTPDAVERAKLLRSALCAAASDADELRATILAERARHAEEVARLEAAHLSDLETIEAWKLASGLECGGDPDGVTPAGMRRYWEGVEADRDSLRDQLREVTMERENRVAEMRAWGEAKLAGAQHEIAHLRDQLRKVEGEREEVLRMIDGLRKSEKTAREYINMRLRDEAQGTAIPELVARLRELHNARRYPAEMLVATIRDDQSAQVYATSTGPMRVVRPVAETTVDHADLIAETLNALPAILDALERLPSEIVEDDDDTDE